MSAQAAPYYVVSFREDKTKTYQPLELGARVLSFSFEDNAHLADELSLTLDNYDLKLLDDPRIRMNSWLKFKYGYAGKLSIERECIIQSMSGFEVLTVKAHAKSIEMNQKMEPKVWDNKTASEVAAEIAGVYGYGSDSYIQDSKVKLPHITRPANMTDAVFMANLARKLKWHFSIEGNVFRFHRDELNNQPIAELVFRQEGSSILSVSIDEDGKKGVGGVKKKGIDPVTKKPIEGKASNEETKRDSLGNVINADAPSAEMIAGKEAVKESVEPTSDATQAAAKTTADEHYKGKSKKTLKLKLTVIGDPILSARRVVLVKNISNRFSGPWFIAKATHKIDGSGYLTELECDRDAHNGYQTKKDIKSKGTPNTKEAKKEDEPETTINASDRDGTTSVAYRRQ